MSIRKALGAVKDRTTIGLARVSGAGAVAADLDVAIVRATSHDDAPPDDRHAREVLRLTSGDSRAQAAACVASLARRLARTRDYVVAAKCVALLQRLASEGGPHFRREILRPATGGRRAGEPVLALLDDFRDDAHPDHSAFVRAAAAYLGDRLRFVADDSCSVVPVHEMPAGAIMARTRQARRLLARFLACRPSGAAARSAVVLASLRPLLTDSFGLYSDVVVPTLGYLLGHFFNMDYAGCVAAFDEYVGAARQIEDLIDLYDWCEDDAGVAPPADFPSVRPIEDGLLITLHEFMRERARFEGVSRSPPPARPVRVPPQHGDTKALPAPEQPPVRSAEGACSKTAATNGDQQLVDLREPADEQGDKLALALFAAPPAAATDDNWVVFPSDDDDDAPAKAITSAWQTPAAEPGNADWEVALVETASKLSRQRASLGGGMDPLLLGGMYDQGAVRRHVAAQGAAAGSASSVALPGGAAGAATLMLPAPDGSAVMVPAAGGDPFAASLAVPAPAYVQMAEMERKQQLLVQEQQMWAQYRQGGMQGQPVGFSAGGTAVAMPMPYNQVSGYY